jgi:hypothetical protein
MVEKNVEVLYSVHLLKNTSKEAEKVFLRTKRRGDEFSLPNCFHGIGFFCKNNNDVEEKVEQEVWIPYSKIEYVESLVYKPR